MKYLIVNLVPIFFILLAGFLAYFNKEYYGWCIFGAVITSPVISKSDENKTTKKD